MINFITLSGLYENSRRVLRLLPAEGNTTHLAQRLTNIAADPKKLAELATAIDNLDSHIRVMGITNMIGTSADDQ